MDFGHEPAGGGGSSADTYALFSFEPSGVYFADVGNESGLGIDLQAFSEKHPSVGTLFPANEQDKVVSAGKLPDIGNAVGDLPTDGVERFELSIGFQLFYLVDDVAEAFYRLGCLGIEQQFFAEVYLVEVFVPLDDDGFAVGLSHQSVDFGVSGFAVDNDLRLAGRVGIVCGFDFTLQLQHDGAGGIDDFDVVLGGDSVGFGRFAVGSQQYFHVVQLFELLVVYGDEPFGFESFHLVAVVYDVAEAVESSGAVEFFFGFADSRDYTEAETRMFVYFYACHNLSPFYLCG